MGAMNNTAINYADCAFIWLLSNNYAECRYDECCYAECHYVVQW